MKIIKLLSVALVLALFATSTLRAQVSDAEFEAMKKDMNDMRRQMQGLKGGEVPIESIVDKAGCSACAACEKQPNNVTTANGKLVMGGLIQVWYQAPADDRQGLFNDPANLGVNDSNAAYNKQGFSIHTVELYFDLAITKHVGAFVYINPAAEIASNTRPVISRRLAQVSPEFAAANGPINGATTASVAALQNGGAATPTLLQDALINFHDFVPHHDFTFGQHLNTFNEENYAPNNQLDFVDRSYIGNQIPRDIGAVMHGSWWCNGGGGNYAGGGDTGRFQYWAGVWNSAGTLYNPKQNAQDDNNNKDFIGTLLLRPIWSDCWGKWEIGYSYRGGRHGVTNPHSATGFGATPDNHNLERLNNWSSGHDGWTKYWAPGALKGLWFKGEAQWVKDRTAPGTVIDQAAIEYQGASINGDGTGIGSAGGAPFSTFGYWGSVGYKFADSPLFCNCGNHWAKGFEIALRYESAPNVFVTDPLDTGRTDGNAQTNVYNTKVYTGGINYYIDGNNAKIQLNYNHLDNPKSGASNPFHRLNSDSLVLNFQVSW